MGLTYKALKYRDIKMNKTKAKLSDLQNCAPNPDQEESMSLQHNTETEAESEAETVPMLVDETTATTTEEATVERNNQQHQFTAEHIMQLCLFLAEKSRAKQLQQSQEMNARRYYENFLKEANDFGGDVDEEMLINNVDGKVSEETQAHKLKSPKVKANNFSTLHELSPRARRRTKSKSEKILKQTILTDKLSTYASSNNNNNANVNYNSVLETCEKSTLTTCHQQYQQQRQERHQKQQQQQQQHLQSQQQDKRDILLKIRQQIFERKRLRQVLLSGGGQRQNAQCHQKQQQQQQQHLRQQKQQQSGFYCEDISPMQQQQQQQQYELQHLRDVWRPW